MTAARSAKITKLQEARIDRLFKQHCYGLIIPVLALNAVYSKGRLLVTLGKDDAEIGAAMRQEAEDAGRHVVQVQP